MPLCLLDYLLPVHDITQAIKDLPQQRMEQISVTLLWPNPAFYFWKDIVKLDTQKKSNPPSPAYVNLNTELVLRERLKQTAAKVWCYSTRLFRLLLQISLWKYLQQSCLWGRSNLIIIHFLEHCQHYRQYFMWGKRNSTMTKVHTFRFIIIFLEEKKES